MDEKKIALIGLDGALREVIFFLDIFLARYASIKFIQDGPLPERNQKEISYFFNAFVRSAKSAVDLMSKLSDKKKPDFMRQFSEPEGFAYLMKLARDAITHGSYDLISGSVQMEIEGRLTWVMVCSPINEYGSTWHTPPSQDGVSLAIDYLTAILKEAERCYAKFDCLPASYWDGIREWEIDSMKATRHISDDWLNQAREQQKTMPHNHIPSLADTTWVSTAIRFCERVRRTTYPTIHLEVGGGRYRFESPSEQ